ncbi:hypothetical protein LZ198_25845 [Myxococcus sp. K15C18031901]|uniref:hypothetical protein n=1 Tax=Myxococcus dinghuensis TaxID=2906761 RepID=UPI0020A7C220|nr:hypothetical protein [Myxococcus dinghuensis]MCP3102298.1 hypothetical protein [Myxococcus dinghuensis]
MKRWSAVLLAVVGLSLSGCGPTETGAEPTGPVEQSEAGQPLTPCLSYCYSFCDDVNCRANCREQCSLCDVCFELCLYNDPGCATCTPQCVF